MRRFGWQAAVFAVLSVLSFGGDMACGQESADHSGGGAQGGAVHAETTSDHAAEAGGAAAADHAEDAHHGDAHHDPYDLSHQNATPHLEDPSELKSDLAIWTFVVFLLLLALLAKFAWGPVVDGLDKREQAISAKIEEAQRSAEQAGKQLQQYEAKLAMAAEEARTIVSQARQDAESAKDRILAEAQEAAARERDRALEDIAAAKNSAVEQITEHSVKLAVTMASQLVRRELTAQDQTQLVHDALAQIPNRN